VQVPEHVCLTSERAFSLLSKELQDALPAALPLWTVLALALCSLKHDCEQRHASSNGSSAAHGASVDETSQQRELWMAYVAELPSSTGSILEWSDALLDRLRQTSLQAKAEELRRAADASWADISEWTSQSNLAGNVVTQSRFRCASHVSQPRQR
jgi:hypothetical protein